MSDLKICDLGETEDEAIDGEWKMKASVHVVALLIFLKFIFIFYLFTERESGWG